MKRLTRWLMRRPWIFALILVLIVAVPGFIRVEQTNNRLEGLVGCVNTWIDESFMRTKLLTQANNERSTALDELIRTVVQRDRDLFQEALDNYIDTSNEYIRVQKDNPIPDPPRLNCKGGS